MPVSDLSSVSKLLDYYRRVTNQAQAKTETEEPPSSVKVLDETKGNLTSMYGESLSKSMVNWMQFHNKPDEHSESK